MRSSMDGALDADIRREAGMSRSNVYQLIVERCPSCALSGTQA